MKAHFSGFWNPVESMDLKLPKGTLIIHADNRYWPTMRKVTQKALQRMADKLDDAVEVHVDLELLLRKRTLDQNALMWSLYEVQANEQNAHRPGAELVTAESLYNADMADERVVPMVEIVVETAILPDLKQLGVEWIAATPVVGSTKLSRVRCVKTSSKWNTAEMARHIEMLFDRLADAGVTDSDAILGYWAKWRQGLSDQKVVYEDGTFTQEEYRAKHRICEGCGKFIGNDEVGHLHHIRSKGAAEELLAASADDWMMLCPPCHGIWTAVNGGVLVFIKKYPWTRFRIERVLQREVDEQLLLPDEPEPEERRVTREMALDAGDPSLEGERI